MRAESRVFLKGKKLACFSFFLHFLFKFHAKNLLICIFFTVQCAFLCLAVPLYEKQHLF